MDSNFSQNSYYTPPPPSRPPSRATRLGLIVIILVFASYFLGFQSGKKGYVFKPKEFKIVTEGEEPKVVDYQLLWDAIKVVDEHYIEKPVEPQKILYGAVRGAVSATGDPYTEFFEPKELQVFETDLEGSFSGIGAEIGKREGNIVIVAPLEGTPAQRAGLLAKDIIVQVNGKPTANWSVEQTVSEIRGEKGTEVTLTIFREDKDRPFEVKLIRETIEIKSVKWEIKNVPSGAQTKNIAVVTISKFGKDTENLLEKAIQEVFTKNAQGIVVDLRNNTGGYLHTSVEVASKWVPQGKVVVTEEKTQGVPQQYKASGNNRLANFKTVVLINGGSASASEILAGALQDYKIATVVGEKSFGKGSVQEIIKLKDGSAVKITIARWITPNGKNLNKEGLQPDIEIKLTEEDISAGKDPQMDRALEEVTK